MAASAKGVRKTPQKESIVIERYIRLFLDYKYILMGIFLVISLVWLLIFPDIYRSRQVFTSSAIIRFDEYRISESASGVDERFTQMGSESRIGILTTRSFLTKVIDSLKLNIIIDKPLVTRSELIYSVKIKERENFGKYSFQFNDSLLNIYYTIEDESEKDVFIKSMILSDSAIIPISLASFDVSLYRNVFDDYSEVELDYIRTRFAVEGIKKRMDVRLRGLRQTMLYINFTSKDAEFGALITNTIAELFLKQLLEFKKFKTSSVINSLNEQLQLSRKELEGSENEVRRFREKNPFVIINDIVEQYSSDLSSDEGEISQSQGLANEVRTLMNDALQTNDFENRVIIFRQLISYLSEREAAGSVVLQSQYTNAIVSHSQLITDSYPDDHQKVIETREDITELQEKIENLANNYLNSLTRRANRLTKNIKRTERQLRGLPQKEIQLARLERRREAKSTIYSKILIKYNEAKVADVSITPDAFLFESADIPIVNLNIMKILILLLIGPIFGLALAAGIIIIVDLIQHKARSVKDIEATLNLPVIANIPVIKSSNEIPKDFDAQKRVESKLITIDYSPSIESESFRNLRTKLIMEKDKSSKRQIIISSLFPGDGKSLVASNLAVTFAQLKKPTLLIDVDIRRGVQHNSFLCKKAPGLSDILSKNIKIDNDSLLKIIQKTTIPNLFLISAGKPVPNPTELLISDKFSKLLQILGEKYTYLIFDTPPIEMIPDALVLNEKIHNLVLTVRYGKTDISRLKSKLNEFKDIKQDIVGVVFNSSKNSAKEGYYSYSYYNY